MGQLIRLLQKQVTTLFLVVLLHPHFCKQTLLTVPPVSCWDPDWDTGATYSTFCYQRWRQWGQDDNSGIPRLWFSPSSFPGSLSICKPGSLDLIHWFQELPSSLPINFCVCVLQLAKAILDAISQAAIPHKCIYLAPKKQVSVKDYCF